MHKRAAILSLAVLCLLAGGCASRQLPETGTASQTLKPKDVAVTIEDYKFIPSTIPASPGETLNLTISNKGHDEHGMEFDFPSGLVSLPSHLRPGDTERFSLKVPSTPGQYHFHCPVGNHYARGMEGEIVVS